MLREVFFPTTHWSALARATMHGEKQARRDLEELCGCYWRPVYLFIRARGVTHAEAQDLTQEFLVHVMERSLFRRADPLQGQFRSFLLGALVRFLGDAADKRNAQKRGGTVPHVSLEQAESSLGAQQSALAFDREWALTILENALEKARAEFAQAGREKQFEVLKTFLPGSEGAPPYEAAAVELGVSGPALKSEVHRLRRQFRQFVLEQVGRTVSAPHEIEAEVQHLQQVLMDKGSQFRTGKKPGEKNS
jgi:DNA-directed RNA polymerase specialized sigma24 family protein